MARSLLSHNLYAARARRRFPRATKLFSFLRPGFSGAELANVVNEAALLSARRGQAAVALPELLEAVYRTK